jgi:hypothetical protein
MSAIPHFGGGDSTTATAASGTGSALSIAKPANVAVGDLLIGNFYNQFSGTVVTPPGNGWVLDHAWASRSGGVYHLAVTDATVLAGLAASWSQIDSGSGRLAYEVFRVPGADLSAPIDVVGAEASQNAAASFTLPSVSPTNAGGLLLAFCYWNNSTTAQSTYTPDAAMSDGEQVKSPTTGNTSGIDVAYQQLTAAGATGTRTVSTSPTGASNSGFLLVVKAAASSALTGSAAFTGAGSLTSGGTPAAAGSVPLSGIGSLAASGGSALAGAVAFTGIGSLNTSGSPAPGGTAAFTGIGSLTSNAPSAVQSFISTPPLNVAHRGGSADWVEHTMFAYDQAAAWSSTLALEVSVYQTSDGVWVASHDQTTTRVFGVSFDIPTTPWATLAGLTTTVGGYPILRLDTLLAKYGGRRVFVVDDKGSQDTPGLLNLLDANGGNGWHITKSYYSAVAWPAAARARGYKTLGYYYDADTASIAASQSRFDVLMEQFDATSASWAAVLGYGKPVMAHIISTAAQRAAGQANGANGYMVAGVTEVVPQTAAAVAFSGFGSLSAGGVPRFAGAVTLSGSGLLAAATAAHLAGAVILGGSGSLTLLQDLRDLVLVGAPLPDRWSTVGPESRWSSIHSPHRWSTVPEEP